MRSAYKHMRCITSPSPQLKLDHMSTATEYAADNSAEVLRIYPTNGKTFRPPRTCVQ